MIYMNRYDREEVIKGIKDIDGMKTESFMDMIDSEDEAFVCSEYVNDKMVAFMFATEEEFDGQRTAFIQVCFSDKKGSVSKFLDLLKDWMNLKEIKHMVFMTKRNADAYERKYGFKEIYKVMHKEI